MRVLVVDDEEIKRVSLVDDGAAGTPKMIAGKKKDPIIKKTHLG